VTEVVGHPFQCEYGCRCQDYGLCVYGVLFEFARYQLITFLFLYGRSEELASSKRVRTSKKRGSTVLATETWVFRLGVGLNQGARIWCQKRSSTSEALLANWKMLAVNGKSWIVCIIPLSTFKQSFFFIFILQVLYYFRASLKLHVIYFVTSFWFRGPVTIRVTKRNVPIQKIGYTSTLEPYCCKYE
jgi:hypothetical protein